MAQKQVSLDQLAEIISERVNGQQTENPRILVAMAGPPGAGKSTSAGILIEKLNTISEYKAAILPMDGYHYDDTILNDRNLIARKGSPPTFDVAGFIHMIARVKQNNEPEIAVPVFDNKLGLSRAATRMIPQDAKIVIIEGNYLLLKTAPWSHLATMFNITVMVEMPEKVLRQRLESRWQSHNNSPELIRVMVEENDLPNGRLISSQSIPAEFVIES